MAWSSEWPQTLINPLSQRYKYWDYRYSAKIADVYIEPWNHHCIQDEHVGLPKTGSYPHTVTPTLSRDTTAYLSVLIEHFAFSRINEIPQGIFYLRFFSPSISGCMLHILTADSFNWSVGVYCMVVWGSSAERDMRVISGSPLLYTLDIPLMGLQVFSTSPCTTDDTQ